MTSFPDDVIITSSPNDILFSTFQVRVPTQPQPWGHDSIENYETLEGQQSALSNLFLLLEYTVWLLVLVSGKFLESTRKLGVGSYLEAGASSEEGVQYTLEAISNFNG